MPYYGVPVNQTDENVAMSFNKTIVNGLLRQKYGFDGVICTDWGLITDAIMMGAIWKARAWGVEHLSEPERVLKALEAWTSLAGKAARNTWWNWSNPGGFPNPGWINLCAACSDLNSS